MWELCQSRTIIALESWRSQTVAEEDNGGWGVGVGVGGGDLTNIATHLGGDYCQCWSKSL